MLRIILHSIIWLRILTTMLGNNMSQTIQSPPEDDENSSLLKKSF